MTSPSGKGDRPIVNLDYTLEEMMSAPMTKKILARLYILLAVVTPLGCDSTGPPNTAAGEYELVAIYGASLPFRLQDSPQVDVTGGYWTLSEDGTYQRVIVYATHFPEFVDVDPAETSGTYIRVGNTLHFKLKSSDLAYSAAIHGDELQLEVGEGLWIFRREP